MLKTLLARHLGLPIQFVCRLKCLGHESLGSHRLLQPQARRGESDRAGIALPLRVEPPEHGGRIWKTGHENCGGFDELSACHSRLSRQCCSSYGTGMRSKAALTQSFT